MGARDGFHAGRGDENLPMGLSMEPQRMQDGFCKPQRVAATFPHPRPLSLPEDGRERGD